MEFYFENPWGDSKENVSLQYVKFAIAGLKEMDEEHGAFWIGDEEGAATLEIHKSLKIFVLIEDEGYENSTFLDNEKEAEQLFQLFFENKLREIREFIDQKEGEKTK
jgi:hypothetical protein